MAAATTSPTSYQLEQIFPIEQHYELLDPDELEKEGGDFDFDFFWNWYLEGEQRFAVMLGVRAIGGKDAPEEVRVGAVAVFSIITPTPDVPLQTFLQRDAPAIMAPFLNEVFVSLTARSLTGVLRLLPFQELANLPEVFPFEASSGTQMLLADKKLAKALGVELSAPAKKARKAKKVARAPESPS